jgi:hypothetical protein
VNVFTARRPASPILCASSREACMLELALLAILFVASLSAAFRFVGTEDA